MFPYFLSVVYLVNDDAPHLGGKIRAAVQYLDSNVRDYELIIIDNESGAKNIQNLKKMMHDEDVPNLHVYSLTWEVDTDTALLVGLENALGDYVAVVDLNMDDATLIGSMLDEAKKGRDVVVARNSITPRRPLLYKIGVLAFNSLYKMLNGIDLEKDAPRTRLVSRKVVNFVLQHPRPTLIYRSLPVVGGFSQSAVEYSAYPSVPSAEKGIWEGINRGMQLLVMSAHAPLRIVTSLSLFGAVANFIYSIYVALVAVFGEHVAPGWASLSLQQSGMFLLISLVLWVLAEYIMHLAKFTADAPRYHLGLEFCSTRMTARERLNVENVGYDDRSKKTEFTGGKE